MGACCSGGLKYQQNKAEEDKRIGGCNSPSHSAAFDEDAVHVGRYRRCNFIVDRVGRSDLPLELSDIQEFYDFDDKLLGVGTYGSVKKCTSKSTFVVRAVKELAKTHARYLDWIKQEAYIMKMMDHPNIIKLFETFEDSKHVYLVMELCAGGGLVENVKKNGGYYTEPQVATLMRQILRTVAYMHKKGICHRDLKPENFLLLTKDPIERNVLKIIDFGVSCTFEPGQQLRDKAGTPFYTSPQILDGRYTEACDLWSCGVIMYILLCGVPPFEGKTDNEVWGKVRMGNFSFRHDAFLKVSEEAKNLIRGLMKYKEPQRFLATEALNHEAIQRYAPRGKDVRIRASIIDKLRTYAFSDKFKKAALHAVVQTSREDQVSLCRETFLALDIDDDGFVTHDELFEALSQAGLSAPDDLEVIVNEVDADRSGAIDYTEFVAATMEETHYLREERCWAAFLIFDRDGDGKISREELEITLGDPEADVREQPQAVVELLRDADSNSDGVIDFSEFTQMMKKGCKFDSPQAMVVRKNSPQKAASKRTNSV